MTYKTFILRVRADSNLADRLGAYTAEGETSINYLVNKLLCEYFDVPVEQKWYDLRKRERLI